MRLGGWNRSGCPIGLDLGAFGVRMLQLERSGDGYAVVAAQSRALPAEVPAESAPRVDMFVGLIRDMLDTGGFSGRKVVSCLPAKALHYKNLRVPRMPADELRAAVEWEAADRLKLPADAMHIQFFDAGEVRQGEELRQEIILLAATNATVDEHLEILVKSDLRPEAIEVVPSALARCADATLEDAQLVVDVGHSSTKALVVKSGRVVFFKLLDVGSQRLDQTVAQHLGLPVADAAEMRRRLQSASPEAGAASGSAGGESQLFGGTRREALERAVFESLRASAGEMAKEISLCLRYYSVTFRGRRPETMLLAGGEAYEPLLARVLGEGSETHVEKLEPLRGVDLSRVRELASAGTTLSEWSVAVGLSKRPTGRAALRGAA